MTDITAGNLDTSTAAPEATATPPAPAEPTVTQPTTPAAPPAANTAAPTQPATPAATSITDEPSAPAVEPTWPDDWREKMAKGDEAVLKRLKRFASPENVFKSFQAAEQKISSGEYKRGLSENPTADEITAFRKEQGIPETPDGYDLTMSDGLVIGEADRPLVSEFAKAMHEQNATPAQMKAALGTYYKMVEAQKADAAERDNSTWAQAQDTLRAEWGADYRAHEGAIKNYLSTLPEGFRNNLIGARMADGTKLLGSVDGTKFVLDLAMQANPAATILPHSSNPGLDIDTEIAAMNKRMGTAEWAKDIPAQQRYMQLVDAKQRMGAR